MNGLFTAITAVQVVHQSRLQQAPELAKTSRCAMGDQTSNPNQVACLFKCVGLTVLHYAAVRPVEAFGVDDAVLESL
jgi:hypothetical protein